MNIRSKKELDEAIIELEKKKAIQYGLMVQQYRDTTESMKPANIVKGMFSNIMHSADAKKGLLKAVAGLGLGFLTRKLFWGNSSSTIKKVLGGFAKAGVAKAAISNVDKIKAYGTAIYHNLFQRKAKQQQDT